MTHSTSAGIPRGCSLASLPASLVGQLSMQALCLMGVLSLVLFSMGPMLDHHFAERHPEHNHIYLGSAIPDHTHSFESSHNHSSSQMLGILMQPAEDIRSDGIVVVSSQDGTNGGAADLTVPMSLHGVRMAGDDESGIPRLSADTYATLSSISISPPMRPPRI